MSVHGQKLILVTQCLPQKLFSKYFALPDFKGKFVL